MCPFKMYMRMSQTRRIARKMCHRETPESSALVSEFASPLVFVNPRKVNKRPSTAGIGADGGASATPESRSQFTHREQIAFLRSITVQTEPINRFHPALRIRLLFYSFTLGHRDLMTIKAGITHCAHTPRLAAKHLHQAKKRTQPCVSGFHRKF